MFDLYSVDDVEDEGKIKILLNKNRMRITAV